MAKLTDPKTSIFNEIVPVQIRETIESINILFTELNDELSERKKNYINKDINTSEIEQSTKDIDSVIVRLRELDLDEESQIAINNKIRVLSGWNRKFKKAIEKRSNLESSKLDNNQNYNEVIRPKIIRKDEPQINKEAKIEKTITEPIKEEIPKVPVKEVVDKDLINTKSSKKQQPIIEIQNEDDEDLIVTVTNDDISSFIDKQIEIEQETKEEGSFINIVESEEESDIKNIVFEESIDIEKRNESISKVKNQLDSIKTVSLSSTNSMIKLMSKTNIDPSTVKMFDIDISKDEDFHRLYLESRNNMLATPRITRVSHVISGFFSEISAYSEYDLISINRNLALEKDYVRQQTLIYNSIFSHVMYSSFKKNPTFEEWCQTLLLPDLNSLFFGIYDANYPGINEYNLECGNCGSDIFLRVDNNDLYCYINKKIEKNYVKNLIKLDTQEMLTNPIKDDILKKTFRKRLPNTGIIIEYGVPSLDTYLKTISALQQIITQNDTNIDIASINDPDSPVYGMLKIYLYIKGIGMPVKGKITEKGTIPIKYASIKDRSQIVAIISSLNRKDFSELFNVKEVRELAAIYGVSYFIKDVHCDNCNLDLEPVLLEPQQVFFSRLGDETNRLQL